MEEDEYRQMYRAAILQQCLFEKAILSQRCACSQARRHSLAEREAVACQSTAGREQCGRWLSLLRTKAVFALQLRGVEAQPLPHAKEIKVQVGGLLGLSERVNDAGEPRWKSGGRVTDVHALLSAARDQFGGLDAVPFDEIVRAVGRYKGRPKKIRVQKRPE